MSKFTLHYVKDGERRTEEFSDLERALDYACFGIRELWFAPSHITDETGKEVVDGNRIRRIWITSPEYRRR
jgi:hypothetical protein